MLIIDQTAGEVEESKLPGSEAELNVNEPLITGKDNTNNKDKTNNNNNKIIHVAVSEVAENESKKSKPSDNINIHESTDIKVSTVSNGRSPKSAAIILTIGLTVHNILEGVAIGLSPSQEKLIMILIGICPHNLLESF